MRCLRNVSYAPKVAVRRSAAALAVSEAKGVAGGTAAPSRSPAKAGMLDAGRGGDGSRDGAAAAGGAVGGGDAGPAAPSGAEETEPSKKVDAKPRDGSSGKVDSASKKGKPAVARASADGEAGDDPMDEG